MPFTRTSPGLIAKFRFYPEVIVWVEGKEDVPFYDQILRKKTCRLEVAGGKDNCLKLANAIVEHNYPYVVIIDGDYEILVKRRSIHRRVVFLRRYSIENYMFEEKSIERVCRNYSQAGDDFIFLDESFQETVTRLENELINLLILDIAHYRSNTGLDVFPSSADEIIDDPRKITFSRDRIQKICNERKIEKNTIDDAQNLVVEFGKDGRIVDIVRGHFMFGIIRNLIINVVRKNLNRKPNFDNNGLLLILSNETWFLTDSPDHRSLKSRILNAIRDAQRLKASHLNKVGNA